MFIFQVPWTEILLRTSMVYFLVLMGIRLTGKRQIGQLSPFDLVLLLLLSNSVQNAMTGPDTSLVGGVVAASALLVLNYGLGFLVQRYKWADRWVEGSPTMLIHKGIIDHKRLKKEGISAHELHQALREHGVVDVLDVRLAVLEVDGSISVVRNEDVVKESRTPRHFKYLNRKSQ